MRAIKSFLLTVALLVLVVQSARAQSCPYTQVSAGGFHTCALRSDRGVACWGLNDADQATPLPGAFREVSASAFATYGLRTDGTIECFGGYTSYIPPGRDYVAVVSGNTMTCALRSDGSVDCASGSGYGELDVPEGEFIQVAAGAGHACALRATGAIECWGANTHGQADPPTGQFTQVTAGYFHSCGIEMGSGVVRCWGDNSKNQLFPPFMNWFTQIDAGGWHTCGRTTDGTAECWGWNFYRQANPPDDVLFAEVSAGERHSCGVRADGEIECWGGNGEKQCNVPDGTPCAVCGDHVVDDVEECDDGNASDGDCCSASCDFEPRRSVCAADVDVCTSDYCSGDGACVHPYDAGSAPECADPICGDANRDDKTTATDALYILKAAVGFDIPCTPYECDLNGDGSIIASDALAMLRIVNGLPTEPECPFLPTTTTTTTTSTTTTSTTTTTICGVTFRLEDDVDLRGLQFEIDYSTAPAEFSGAGDEVECISLVDGTFVFDDDDWRRIRVIVEITNTMGSPLSGPIDLLTCRYEGGALSQSDLNIVFIDSLADDATYGEPGSGVCGAPATGLTPGTVNDMIAVRYGTLSGECPLCECDANNDGIVSALDWLMTTSAALGDAPPLTSCRPCDYPPDVRGPLGDPVAIVVAEIVECF